MKTKLILPAALLIGLTGLPSTARADWRIDLGVNLGGVTLHGGYSAHRHVRPRHHVRVRLPRPVHIHARVPVYTRVWVPPVYKTVLVGRDCYGLPIHRTVVVRSGHYRTLITAYRCHGCGVILR